MAHHDVRPTYENLVWYYVLGGLFLGFWFIFALVEEPAWFSWGMIGLLIATALYGARASNDAIKIALWVLVGVSIGGLVALMVIEGQANVIATLITGTGAGLIAAGLPTPGQHPGIPQPAATPHPAVHDQPVHEGQPRSGPEGETLRWSHADEADVAGRRAS